MGGFRRMREIYDYQHLSSFPNKNLILTHHMLSAWWLNLLEGLLHYVILLGSIEQVLVITNNITTLGYIYSNLRLKNPPDIVYKITHIGRIIAWTP